MTVIQPTLHNYTFIHRTELSQQLIDTEICISVGEFEIDARLYRGKGNVWGRGANRVTRRTSSS